MPVSIRDVAARAGVSLGTVSKVLNESTNAHIAQQTRARVRLAAEELGYHPSAIARALVRKQMDTVGVVLPPGQSSPLQTPFFAALFDAVLHAAAARQQNVTVFVGQQWQGAARSLPMFRDGRCDGLLLFYQPPESDIVSALLDARVPVVAIDDPRDDPRLSFVDVDNVSGARRATEHLIGLGHRRIAILREASHLNYVAPRLEGYSQALEAAEISLDPSLVLDDGNAEQIQQQLHRQRSRPISERPTAMVCMGDPAAQAAIAALGRLGVRVPDEFSVVGFNDEGLMHRDWVPLTTMRQPYAAIGNAALELLLDQVSDIGSRGRQVLLETELIVRSTTAPPARVAAR